MVKYTRKASGHFVTLIEIGMHLTECISGHNSFPGQPFKFNFTDFYSGPASRTWTVVGAAAGGVVALAIVVGVSTWWVHKQRKCRKDTKSKDQTLLASRRLHESRQRSYWCWPTYKRVISNV